MSVQSATASATVLNSSARASSGSAPTAERASRKASSKGFTTRRWKKPKLLMARAAAPMLRGLRGATRMTRRRSDSALGDKGDEFTAVEDQQRGEVKREGSGETPLCAQEKRAAPRQELTCVGGEG